MIKKVNALFALWCVLALGMATFARAENAKPRVIEVTGNDAMKYNISEIDAQPGEALEVVMTNIGELPKAAMSHNWVLLKPMTDEEISAFAMSAMTKAPDYLPDDKSAVLAHTKTLGSKESDKVDFNAPTAKGEYPFICTFPGHFAMMKGKLIVK
jgi:azurin